MACYHPLHAVRMSDGSISFKEQITKLGLFSQLFQFRQFRGLDIYPVEDLKLPCGRCIGCRLERSKQWALRCIHEASLHDQNCFITLTFDDEYMNVGGSLDKRDFQLFMKRLRKKFGAGIRFFHCGEYGDQLERPHHHACLFGFDFPDKVLFRAGKYRLYRSKALEELWPYGFCTIGSVSFDSAAYVARYVMKKVTGEMAEDHYQGRQPEYVTMSRRPGIARKWFEQFAGDVFPKDYINFKGMKLKPPRYYDEIFSLTNEEEMLLIKERRKKLAELSPDNTPERLAVREQCVELAIKRKKRNLGDSGVVGC